MPESNKSNASTQVPDKLWLCEAFAVTLGAFVLATMNFPRDIANDCAMYLRCGQYLCHAAVPYHDFMDLNPPLIMYLNMLPALASRLLSINLISCFFVLVTVIALLSVLLINKIIGTSTAPELKALRGPITIASAYYVLISQLLGGFGQRDFFIGLALTAYFFLRWIRWNDDSAVITKSISIPTCVAMALTVCLKPYFLLAPLCLELFWIIQRKSIAKLFTVGIVSGLIIGLSYLLLLLILPGEMSQTFFKQVLPMVAAGYSVYNCEPAKLFWFPVLSGILPLTIIGMFAAFVVARKTNTMKLVVPLCLCITVSYAIFCYQDKGWLHQLLEVVPGACCLVAIAAARLKHTRFLIVFNLLLALLIAPYVACTALRKSPDEEECKAILQESKAKDCILILSTNVCDSFPALLKTNRYSACRYLFMFPIPLLGSLEEKSKTEIEKEAWQAQENLFVTQVGADIAKSKPELLITPMPKDTALDKTLVGYFKEKGLWQKYLSDFKFVRKIDGPYEPLGIWKRQL